LTGDARAATGESLEAKGPVNRIVRRRFEMAVRVRDFCQAHPSTDASFAPVIAQLEESNERRWEHVGARADLTAVRDEMMRLVAMPDGLNRYRFSGNAELLAAWESARKVLVGPRAPEEPAAETQPVVRAPKAEGDVRPACDGVTMA
jgi:hypothetical protein